MLFILKRSFLFFGSITVYTVSTAPAAFARELSLTMDWNLLPYSLDKVPLPDRVLE